MDDLKPLGLGQARSDHGLLQFHKGLALHGLGVLQTPEQLCFKSLQLDSLLLILMYQSPLVLRLDAELILLLRGPAPLEVLHGILCALPLGMNLLFPLANLLVLHRQIVCVPHLLVQHLLFDALDLLVLD